MKLNQAILNKFTELQEDLIQMIEDWGSVKEISYEFNDNLPEGSLLAHIDFHTVTVEVEFILRDDKCTLVVYGEDEDCVEPASGETIWRIIAHKLLAHIAGR